MTATQSQIEKTKGAGKNCTSPGVFLASFIGLLLGFGRSLAFVEQVFLCGYLHSLKNLLEFSEIRAIVKGL